MAEAVSIHTTIPPGLARQQRERERALKRLVKLRKKAADEIEKLIAFLDQSDTYVMTELEEDDREDVGDDEPSLGSFDRMTNQEKSWRVQSLWAFPAVDAEQDDYDREDDDPNEAKQQPPEMTPCA
jgi:hypothetical protein